MKPKFKPKLARNLPAPKPLSQEDFERIGREARANLVKVDEKLRSLESLDADDMRIKLR
ncbi:hypothetical protein G6O69_34690 [Pseudenhygromyxa sp. WMMC2535]|uniref:hypothetical protein n=1 Tax=Pseudenhygromyxa sp. WMMC2535 TaxID=2712867 RepID=UPI001554B5A2|nr:hypothetical protein [Pseudenhygromyxa sp. WMMC2535]NVB43022.1 hypothetical protein [Pseudenhygromyxa sp. WMMC2535]